MSTTDTPTAEDELKDLAKTTKRGFDLKARLKNRGLRHGTITLFLDEDKGVELGWAFDKTDAFGNIVGREREGAIGKLEAIKLDHDTILESRKADIEARAEYKTEEAWQKHLAAPTGLEQMISELEAQVASLTEELTKTAIVLKLKSVPPVIEKDCRRLAKDKLEITGKGIPDDVKEEFNIAVTAFLMTKIVESITDNESGGVILSPVYEDAIDLMEQLPSGQYTRLDQALGRIQFTDAISRSIEGQEDFS